MDHFLDFLKFSFDAEEFVCLKRVLPLPQIDFHLWEHERVVSHQLAIEDSRGLELVSKLHDELVEEGVGTTLVVVHVGHGCSRNSVEGDPTVALSDLVLQRD